MTNSESAEDKSIDSEAKRNISPVWNNTDTPPRLETFEEIPGMVLVQECSEIGSMPLSYFLTYLSNSASPGGFADEKKKTSWRH